MTRPPKERGQDPRGIRPEDITNMTETKGLRIPRADVGAETLEMSREQTEAAQKVAAEPEGEPISPEATIKLTPIRRAQLEAEAIARQRTAVEQSFVAPAATGPEEPQVTEEPAEVSEVLAVPPEFKEEGEYPEPRILKELAPFTKEQLSYALGKSIDVARAYKAEDTEATRETLGQLKIVFTRELAIEHRDVLEKKLGQTFTDLSSIPESYSGEDPIVLEKLLKPQRAKLLTAEHPFLYMRYNKDTLEIKVKKIVPELQKIIYTGGATAADFEADVARMGPQADSIMVRLKKAERARAQLSPEEWRALERAVIVLDDPKDQRMAFALNFINEEIPVHAWDEGRRQARQKNPRAIKVLQAEVQPMLSSWYAKLKPEEKAAAEKYVTTAVELYSGTLSQK